MGIIAKGAKCNIEDCDKDGLRSLNTKRVEKAVSYTHLRAHEIACFI